MEKGVYYKKKGLLSSLLKIPDKPTDESAASSSNIILPKEDHPLLVIIREAACRMNKMTILVYQFIKAFYLHSFQANPNNPPTINVGMIRQIYGLISEGTNSGNPDVDLKNFRDNFFRPFDKSNALDSRSARYLLTKRDSLSYSLDCEKVSILTAIENNIKVHFVKRFRGFINTVLQHEIYGDESGSTRSEIKQHRKDIVSRFYSIKTHLFKPKKSKLTDQASSSTDQASSSTDQVSSSTDQVSSSTDQVSSSTDQISMEERINFFKRFLPSIEVSVEYDLKASPQKFLPSMIRMNQYLHSIDRKQFHCFPLRSDIVPKHFEIDTKALLWLLPSDMSINKLSRSDAASKGVSFYRDFVWNLFDQTHALFRPKDGYVFDNSITTDGYSVSLRFRREDISPKQRKGFKKSSASSSTAQSAPKKENSPEFPYLKDLFATEFASVQDAHRVYVDPGKGNLIYCIDDEGQSYTYSRGQRLFETRQLHMQKRREEIKKRTDKKRLREGQRTIQSFEEELSHFDSKTVDFIEFMKYVRTKNRINKFLFEYYEKKFHRKMKLRQYINTQRSESGMITDIRKTFSRTVDGKRHKKPIVLIYGDRNIGPQMKGVISTPMIGLKRRLRQAFKVYNFDEFRTSCLDWRSSERNEKALGLVRAPGPPTRTGQKPMKRKRIHGVLVSHKYIQGRRSSNRIYQNRDLNAACNIRKLALCFLASRTRPGAYCRSGEDEYSPTPESINMLRQIEADQQARRPRLQLAIQPRLTLMITPTMGTCQ